MKDPKQILEKALAKNEPVFVMRAQDILSIVGLSAYIATASTHDMSSQQYEELLKLFEEFEEWWENNPENMKLPD